jgi:uncharacterized membrane protein YgcG
MLQEVNMKQKLLWVCLTLIALSVPSFAAPVAQEMVYEESAYEDDEPYTSENGYIYDDAYSSVNWDTLDRDRLYYSYYDDENVFMVVSGRRVYIIPYDYFYYRIWPHHRSRFSYCHYDMFSDWWGVPFYNRIWYRYHHNHYGHYSNYHRYNRYHDFYRDHNRRPRVVIHKDGWRSPRTHSRLDNRNWTQGNSNRLHRSSPLVHRSDDTRLRTDRRSTSTSRQVIRSRSSDRSSDRRSYRPSSENRSSRRATSSSSRSGSSSSRSSVRSGSSSRSSGSSSSGSSSGSSSRGTAVRKR